MILKIALYLQTCKTFIAFATGGAGFESQHCLETSAQFIPFLVYIILGSVWDPSAKLLLLGSILGRWEDEVIWDHEHMPVKLEPKIVSLDPNDDNIILGIPEDIDPSTLPSDEPVRKVKIIQKHVKKSRMLLNRLNRVPFWES